MSALCCLSQHLPSYLCFSYLGHGVSLHGWSSKAQLLLLTLEEGYLLTAAPPNLECGIAPLGPPAPAQPLLLGCGVAPPSRCPWPPMQGGSSWPFLCRAAWHSQPLPRPRTWGNSSLPLPFGHGVLPASAPDLGRGVTPLDRALCVIAASRAMRIVAAPRALLYFTNSCEKKRGEKQRRKGKI